MKKELLLNGNTRFIDDNGKTGFIFSKQDYIEKGFKDINGNTWSDAFIGSYNLMTDEINKSAGIPVYSDSLTMQERDFMLDQRHRHYVMVADILNTK